MHQVFLFFCFLVLIAHMPVPVCIKTCRPFSRVLVGGERVPWQAAAEAAFGPLVKQIKTRRMWAQAAIATQHFPASETDHASLTAYMFKRQGSEDFKFPVKVAQMWTLGTCPTLPANIADVLVQEYRDHASAGVLGLDIHDFEHRWTMSIPLERRQAMEDAE